MKSVFNGSDRNGGAGKGDLGKSGERAAVVRAVAEIRSDFLVPMRPSDGTTLAFEAELAGGARLSDLGKRRFGSERVPLRFGLRILLDALSGVAALHGSSLRFAHGEVAPWNVVVGHDGFPRLIPLVAAHAEEGAPPSTDATGYVAPERLRGDPFDHRADVFSAGVMLWEMITGRSFRGLPPDVITAWVVDGKVPDPVHPDDAPWVVELARVATRALSVNPGDRWPHVGILGDEIETIAAGHIASRQEVAALFSGASQVKVVGGATDDRKAASR